MTGRLVGEEKFGCCKILNMMSLDNILSLHQTVMHIDDGRINAKEAISEILSHTKDAEELLKRRKVERDIIFKYLQNEGVSMPQNIVKPQVVKQALEHWRYKKVQDRRSVPMAREKPVLLKARSSEPTPISSPPIKSEPWPPVQASVKPENVRQPQTSDIFSIKLTADSSGLDLPVLARQFCQWFYHLLSSQNPSLGQAVEAWGPQHFWGDVTLRLLSSAGEQYTEEFQGAELVSLRLLALAREEKLLLSPNLEPHGLRALSSPHGLVLVAVAGTIHRDGACLGIYEQVFGLIRSPLDNKWKIKFTEVKMRGRDGLRMGNEMSSPTLTWDPSELLRLKDLLH